MKAIYRISDGSYIKDRFHFATKRACLRNFLRVFNPSTDDLLIIADNVHEETWRMVNELHPHTIRANICHGAGSWRYGAFDIALKEYPDHEIVYFVEDDYLHLPDSQKILLEGMAVADYVSLYDHYDKYLSADRGGSNPFIKYGGEVTRVIRTKSSHWKLTNSTTMTFATTMSILREDQAIWAECTQGHHPQDFQAFVHLARKRRTLITPIPGYSTHCEPRFASPGIDWEKVARDFS